MPLSVGEFGEYFESLHGVAPFPWQKALFEAVAQGEWPSPVGLPTASGKTAVIDIAVFALACGLTAARRRIFFIVDRRIVVDEAAERAERIARRLQECLKQGETSVLGKVAKSLLQLSHDAQARPLEVATLRGGTPRDDIWTRSPLQPMVCCTTVDQVGSSLLFRAYGSRSNYDWPVRAALAGLDALYLADEAHLSTPFLETARRIAKQYGTWAEAPVGKGITVVELSATPGTKTAFELTASDRAHPLLAARIGAKKAATLHEVKENETLPQRLVEEAERLAKGGSVVTGVVVNQVATAREVFDRLRTQYSSRVLLLTGRVRPFERDLLWRQWRPLIEAGRSANPTEPIWVVATQCIEAGANIDFTGLVTETAPFDSLAQRFGRLDRFGRQGISSASIVYAQPKDGIDPVYGEAPKACWKWLKNQAKSGKKKGKKAAQPVLDFGIAAMERMGTPPREILCDVKHAPVLMPLHVDLLAQTAPAPEPALDVALYLHGPSSGPADVRIVWRGDLREGQEQFWEDLVAIVPPSPGEALSMPIWAVRRWLSSVGGSSEVADLEGSEAPASKPSPGRPALAWRGTGESSLVAAEEIRPGETLVVPSAYGGCDAYGWNPESSEEVRDLGSPVALKARGRAVLRIPDHSLGSLEESRDLRADLRLWSMDDGLSRETKTTVRLLLRAKSIKCVPHPADERAEFPRIAAVLSEKRWERRRGGGDEEFEQETQRSSWTREVGLEAHQEAVARRASAYSEGGGLTGAVKSTVETAARWHDIGKADPRFQSWLLGGAPWVRGLPLLAKSGGNTRDPLALKRARVAAGYPDGGRHELLSAAIASKREGWGDIEKDLMLHLIAAHHGRCRPFAPYVEDSGEAIVDAHVGGVGVQGITTHNLHQLGSGVAERYWRLVSRYGWWGLAWLEAIVRLADQRVSEEEQA